MERLPFTESNKQPDPQAPLTAPSQPPSLLLYMLMALAAVALITVSFHLSKPDWPALLLNLATNILAALLILIIIDRRLRASELLSLKEYVATTPVRFAALVSRDIAICVSYSHLLNRELLMIRPRPFFERRNPDLETALDNHPLGFMLVGDAGAGKSTIIQLIASRQAESVLHHPRKELIPVLLPLLQWKIERELNGSNLHHQLWKRMSDYAPVSRDRFDDWLNQKRVLVILDGFDEVGDEQADAIADIIEFKTAFPHAPIIISTRPGDEVWDQLELAKIEIPPLTDEEMRDIRLLSSRNR